MKINDLIKKLQNQPEHIRKTILWVTVIVVGLGLFFWWIDIVKKRIENIKKEQFKETIGIPQLEERLKEIPNIKIPVNEEEFKKLEEMMEEAENNQNI